MSRPIRAALAALALLPGLAACGFTPMYAQSTGVAADLSSIDIETGQGRIAYVLRQDLLRQFGSAAGGAGDTSLYELDIQLNERRAGSGLRLDAINTRFALDMSANYTLTERASGRVVGRGRVSETTSFDATDEPYAAIAAEENAREQLAGLLADALRLEISRDLVRQRTAPPA